MIQDERKRLDYHQSIVQDGRQHQIFQNLATFVYPDENDKRQGNLETLRFIDREVMLMSNQLQ